MRPGILYAGGLSAGQFTEADRKTKNISWGKKKFDPPKNSIKRQMEHKTKLTTFIQTNFKLHGIYNRIHDLSL